MYTEEEVDDIVKHYDKTEEDLKSAANLVVQMINKDKLTYLYFGPYWWAMKRLIQEHHEGTEWFMRDYFDQLTFEKTWHGSWLRTVSAAMFYQTEQIMQTSNHSILVEGQEIGYTLADQDSGIML